MKRILILLFVVSMFMISANFVLASEAQWQSKANMLVDRSVFVGESVNNKLYVIGGTRILGAGGTKSTISNVEEYDPYLDQWATKANMPTNRSNTGSGVVNDKIYVIGGIKDNSTVENKCLKKVEEYDPTTNSWTTKADMPTGRFNLSVTEYKNVLYAFGGSYTLTDALTNKVEVYDPSINSWSTKANMTSARARGAAVEIGGFIYYFGGAETTPQNITAKVEAFDPLTNTWSSKTSMPSPRASFAYTIYNGKFYVIGGTDGTEDKSDVYVYDPVTDSWQLGVNIPLPKNNASAVTIADKIFVLGGNSGSVIYQTVDSFPHYSTANAPTLIANGENKLVTLTWNDVEGATGYNVKKSLIPGGPYVTIVTNVTGISYTDTDVTNGTSYYYVVTAINASGESANSNEASANPQGPVVQPETGRALLTITLDTGLEKEFDLSMAEINSFISWYEGKAAGSGTASYAIDKHDNNKGPFKNRKDYVIFDKILTFEVNEYEVTE